MLSFNRFTNSKKTQEPLVVVDIGTTKVAMVAGWFDENKKFHVIDYAGYTAQGLFRGSIVNSNDIVKVLNRCLVELKGKLELNEQAQKLGMTSIKEVVVGISSQNINSCSKTHQYFRTNKKEAVQQDEIDKWLAAIQKHETEQKGKYILHVVPQFYTVGEQLLQIKSPVGYLCNELTCHYHIVSIAEEDIEKTKYCLQQVGLTVKNIIFEPIASAASVLNEQEKELGVALLDIGGGTSDLVVYHKGSILFSHVLTLGGNLITEDIYTLLGLTKNMAEQLKVRYGSCIPDLQSKEAITVRHHSGREQLVEMVILSKIIEYRINSLLEAVFYKLFEDNQCGEILKCGLVVTGGGSLIRNLVQAIKMKGIDARCGQPANHIIYSEDTKGILQDPRFSTLLGLPAAHVEHEIKQKKRTSLAGSITNSITEAVSEFVFKDN